MTGRGVVVFGSTGQVARELARRAPESTFLGREHANLSQPKSVAAAILSARPRAVINAAAWTAVDLAEVDEEAAYLVNAASPGVMARACADLGIPFLHISTDYVFDGSGTRPWAPLDTPAPLSAYGRTKLAGEAAVKTAGGKHLILRTSWIFSAHGTNFLKTMLRLGASRDSLNVVADQIGGPTPADAIADALLHTTNALLDGAPGGIHHFAGSTDTSWAGFARAIFNRAGLSCTVHDTATVDWPTPARRPLNSRLDCSSFEAAFGISRPRWREAIDRIAAELKEQST